MSGRIQRLGAVRLALAAGVVLAALIVPSSAQADEVFQGGCGAQLTANEGENSAAFTIRCAEGVQGLRFTASEGVLVVPPVVQPSSGDPTHGFPCLPSGGTPDNPQITCQSGPPPLGSPGLASNEIGTIALETQDPCGANLAFTELIVDTGGQGEEATPPVEPPEEDVVFTRDINVQCAVDGGGDGGGAPGGDEENFARGRTFEDHPRGGVDAGLGGSANDATAAGVETKRVSVLPSLIAGSALLVIGLASGGLALVRRR